MCCAAIVVRGDDGPHGRQLFDGHVAVVTEKWRELRQSACGRGVCVCDSGACMHVRERKRKKNVIEKRSEWMRKRESSCLKGE